MKSSLSLLRFTRQRLGGATTSQFSSRRCCPCLTTSSATTSPSPGSPRSRRRSYSSTATSTTAKATATGGYQSIGSFHSDNVEVLANLPDDQYTPPELPFDALPTNAPSLDRLDLSRPFQYHHLFAPDYLLDLTNWTFLNHGAFGAALKCGHHRAQQWRDYLELQPLRYFDRELLPHLVHSNRRMAKFVHGDYDGMAIVENVTGALNAVIGGHARCFPKAKVLYFDVSYGSVKKMTRSYRDTATSNSSSSVGSSVVEIPFEEEYLPLIQRGDIAPQEAFAMALDRTITELKRDGSLGAEGLENSLLILDHTTSNTAVNLPIKALANRAKAEGMMVLVDGAHGLLAHSLNMRELTEAGVDFYVSNAHKWLSSPRGAAMLYCGREELRESVLRYPAVVSHGIDDGYLSRFLWDGCRDYAAQLSLPVILDYWSAVSPDNVRDLLRTNLIEGVKYLAAMWHPSRLDDCGSSLEHATEAGVTLAPMSMHSPMALVRLPDTISDDAAHANRKTSTDAKAVQDFLFANRIEVPIKCVRGALYVRVSCHVYNTAEDFERLLGRAVLAFLG